MHKCGDSCPSRGAILGRTPHVLTQGEREDWPVCFRSITSDSPPGPVAHFFQHPLTAGDRKRSWAELSFTPSIIAASFSSLEKASRNDPAEGYLGRPHQVQQHEEAPDLSLLIPHLLVQAFQAGARLVRLQDPWLLQHRDTPVSKQLHFLTLQGWTLPLCPR